MDTRKGDAKRIESPPDPDGNWAWIDDRMLVRCIEIFAQQDGVFQVTVHKRRIVKVQRVSKENLLETLLEE